MTKWFFILALLIVQNSFAQKLDTTIYEHLLRTDNNGFIDYAKSVGLTVHVDSSTNLLTAKTKGVLFFKQLVDTTTSAYKLEMVVSTLDKENNKFILRNAKLIDAKADMWMDDEFLYRQWDLENEYSKEMWYKVLIYKKR